jgi:branched-chain amino acid transport system ATP-binding protein
MLEVKDVRTLLGRKIEALKGVTLTLHPGEIVTLIGANGAGKSTLLRTIAGQLHADSGEIWFEGQMIRNKPAHQVAALGVVYVRTAPRWKRTGSG